MISGAVKNNFIFYSVRLIFSLVYDIVYFPVWWYSRGAFEVLVGLGNMIVNEEKNLALFVWVKNIFKPMYGVHDWAGVLISIIIRVFQIIIRSIALVVWIVIAITLFIAWLALPVLVISQIYYQFQ